MESRDERSKVHKSTFSNWALVSENRARGGRMEQAEHTMATSWAVASPGLPSAVSYVSFKPISLPSSSPCVSGVVVESSVVKGA